MPTHRDYPWERDARAERERGARGAPEDAVAAARRRLALGPRPVPPRSGRPLPATRRSPLRRPLTGPEILSGLLVAVVGIAVAATRDTTSPVRSAPLLPSGAHAPSVPLPTEPPGRVDTLHSRFATASTVEIWGAADGPDGTTVRVVIRAGHERQVVRMPVASGRFYEVVRLRGGLQGRRISLRAGVRP